jgi:hypothetical protein
VAHRLNTVLHYNRILVMKNGKVRAILWNLSGHLQLEGQHDLLVKTCDPKVTGLYFLACDLGHSSLIAKWG